jgi:hypothetical protein
MQNATTLLTLVNSANLLAGSAFEFARARVLVSAGVTASATGTFITINSGADVVLEESPPYEAVVFPIVPDQMFYNDVMEQGDRLRIAARNPTAGTIVFRHIVLMSNI